MSNKDKQKSANNSVDRSAILSNESASAQPTKQPTKSKLDDYTPPPRKKDK
ncbi:MAG: hypothetical protein LGB78_06285 [Sulfurovum sp.]|nr:hypothetical protein [Sulfurovum sp.]